MATAPVYERTGRYVCSACGEARQRYPNTVVTTEGALLQAFEAAPPRVPLLPLGLAIVSAGGFGMLQSAVPEVRWLAGFGAVCALAAALHLGRRARRQRYLARARRRYEIEQRIIGLAFCNDGLLSAGLVSETLRISLAEAHELLGELVSTARARADVSADGGPTVYHFGEAKRTRGLRRSQSS